MTFLPIPFPHVTEGMPPKFFPAHAAAGIHTEIETKQGMRFSPYFRTPSLLALFRPRTAAELEPNNVLPFLNCPRFTPVFALLGTCSSAFDFVSLCPGEGCLPAGVMV